MLPGMFSVLKVREGLASGDYKDPGWYKHPEGTVAHLVDERAAAAPRAKGAADPQSTRVDVHAVKPRGSHQHNQ